MDYFDQRLWFFMIGALKTNSITGHGNYDVYHSFKEDACCRIMSEIAKIIIPKQMRKLTGRAELLELQRFDER